jgi:hypothetical protein
MQTEQRSSIVLIARFLPSIEKLSLLLLVVSGVMILFKQPGEQLLMLSLSTLATVFFLRAQTPGEYPASNDTPMGFRELLAFSILPKVLWISASIGTIGILFHLLGLSGARQMLVIGATSLSFAVTVLAVLFVTGARNLNILRPLLFRVLPLLIVTLYIILKAEPIR